MKKKPNQSLQHNAHLSPRFRTARVHSIGLVIPKNRLARPVRVADLRRSANMNSATLLLVVCLYCVAAFLYLRACIRCYRLLTALRKLNDDQVGRIPLEVRNVLQTKWKGLQVFTVMHEVGAGDISWASELPFRPLVVKLRRATIHAWIGIAAALVMFFAMIAVAS